MSIKQTIAIIGATGEMGSAISRSLAGDNYRLLLYSNDQAQLRLLVESILNSRAEADVEGIACTTQAAWEADIIIAAVPYEAEKEIAVKIKDVANTKIVISISNPVDETYNKLITANNTSAAEELQKLLPNSKVVKAFNTTFATDFSVLEINGSQVDSFIAGDSGEALQTVAALVSAAGFNPVIAGDLYVSRTLENMQLLLIQLTIKYNYNRPAGWKILHN